MKLHQHVADMVTRRLDTDEQPLRYLTVREAFAEGVENLELPLGQAGVTLRSRPPATVEGSQ